MAISNMQSSEVPDYLAHFDLEKDPFENVSVPFFEGGERKEQLDELLHLCQFSPTLIAVTGDAGVGKRAYKSALCARLAPTDMLVEVDVPVLSSAQQMLQDLAEYFGVAVSAQAENVEANATVKSTLISGLKSFGAQAEEEDALKIILVNQAHQLDDETLECFAALSEPLDGAGRSLHFVLFGESTLESRIAALDEAGYLTKNIAIAPLSEVELKSYLRFRLEAAGFAGIFPFKEEDISFLFDVSQGIPGAVHDPARDLLIEMATPKTSIAKAVGLPWMHIGLVGVLVGVLLIALIIGWVDDDEAAPTELVKVQSGNGESTPLPNPIQTVSPPQRKDDGELPDNLAINRSVATAAPPATGFQVEQQDIDTVTDRLDVNDKLPVAPQQAEKTNEVAVATKEPAKPTLPKPRAAPVSSPQKVVVNSESVSSEKDNSLEVSLLNQVEEELRQSVEPAADEQYLLGLNKDRYTLQVLAGSNLAAASDFISRQANRNDLKVYAAKRNGQTFYIVVAGNYTSSDAAKAAIAGLPTEQKKAGPWARPLSSIHQDIRSR